MPHDQDAFESVAQAEVQGLADEVGAGDLGHATQLGQGLGEVMPVVAGHD